MKAKMVILILVLLYGFKVSGQISPPGEGRTKTGSWFAIGWQQYLDKASKVKSMTYVGVGRKSTPEDGNAFYRQAIWIFNQEVYRSVGQHGQVSLALSYRRQNEYQDQAPFEKEIPSVQQEFRLYSRISWGIHFGRIKLSPTFRQELRRFYSPVFTNVEEITQLRSRIRLQCTIPLDKKKRHALILNSEQLLSTSLKQNEQHWTPFKYKESRFSIFWEYAIPDAPVLFHIGYMNNPAQSEHSYDAHIIALDCVFSKKPPSG